MIKSDYPSPDTHIFYCDKSDWYVEDEDGTQDWSKSEDKITEFWQRVRNEKMTLEDLDFSEFIFPEFRFLNEAVTFWEKSTQEVFPEDVTFFKTKFLGEAEFSDAQFLGEAYFKEAQFSKSAIFLDAQFSRKADFFDAKFLGEANFFAAKFMEKVNFHDVQFSGGDFSKAQFSGDAEFFETQFSEEALFFEAQFSGEANFKYVKFSGEANFARAKFSGETDFLEAQFSGVASFFEAQFSGVASFVKAQLSGTMIFFNTQFLREVDFFDANFLGEVVFKKAQFSKRTNFSFTRFLGKQILFEDCVRIENDRKITLKFENVNINDSVIFRRIDLTNTSFKQADLVNTQFKECDFGGQHRLILKDEEGKDYKAMEDLYRQLKKNFDSAKDWELSGRAFYSEMQMYREWLYQKRKAMWLVYWFYGVFGGYTQRIKNPILSILGLIGVFSIFFYFIDCNVGNAIQRGFFGAFPKFIDITTTSREFPGYWLVLKNLEFILGSTFLTFLILALRKQFKQ